MMAGAAYARPNYLSSVDPARSGIPLRSDDRSRGLDPVVPPSASETLYGLGRI